MLYDPVFWTAVGFVVLVVLTGKSIAKSIAGGLDARAERIKATLAEAADLRTEAQSLLADYQRRQRDALKESEQIVTHAKAEAKRLAEKAAADLEAAIKRREQMALEKIAQAETEALRQVRETAVDLAVMASRALIAEKITAERTGKLVDNAINELADKLH